MDKIFFTSVVGTTERYEVKDSGIYIGTIRHDKYLGNWGFFPAKYTGLVPLLKSNNFDKLKALIAEHEAPSRLQRQTQ